MKTRIPDTVLATDLRGEGVLLDVATGQYFGLDEVGFDMWKSLAASGTVEGAHAALLELYDVADDVLARDLAVFVEQLASRKLLVLTDA